MEATCDTSVCFQAPAAVISPATCSAGIASGMLSGTNTASKSLRSGCVTDASTRPQSSAISEHSPVKGTPSDIGVWLRSLLGGFLASPSVSQAGDAAAKMNATCGPPRSTCFALYDHGLHCWRTSQGSFLPMEADTLGASSVDWPKRGLMRDGRSYPLPTQGRHTYAKGSGLWPTPVADDCVNRKEGKWNSRGEPKLSAAVKVWRTPCAADAGKGGRGDLVSQMKGWKQWSTPTVNGNHNRKELSPSAGDGLATAVKRTWATPTASDWKGGTDAIRKDTGKPRSDRLDHQLEPDSGGRLNPDWVEWLMGWPQGWTSTKPLNSDTWAAWLQGHDWRVDPHPQTPRLATRHKTHKQRLKVLGNGWVPQTGVLAWVLLTRI